MEDSIPHDCDIPPPPPLSLSLSHSLSLTHAHVHGHTLSFSSTMQLFFYSAFTVVSDFVCVGVWAVVLG